METKSKPYTFNTRHLSAQETITDIQQSHGGSILIHAAMIQSEIKLTQMNFETALRKLVEFQPALRMRISAGLKKDDGKRSKNKPLVRRFEEMDPIQIDFTMQFSDERHAWIQMVENEMAMPFDSQTGPLWKVIYVEMPFVSRAPSEVGSASNYGTLQSDDQSEPNYMIYSGATSIITASSSPRQDLPVDMPRHEGVIIFKVHHAIADAVSLMNLMHDQLLPILKGTLTSSPPPNFAIPSHMMPAADESFKMPRLTSKFLKVINYESAVASKPLPPPIDGVRPPPVPLLGTQLVPGLGVGITKVWCYKLPKALSFNLREACRRQKVSLEDVLIYSTCSTMARTNRSNIKLPGDSVLCSRVIDLRQFHRKHGHIHPLGLWVGHDIIRYKVSKSGVSTPEQFWKAAGSFVSSQAANREPWASSRVYQDLLEAIQAHSNVRHVAEMFKSHFELSLVVKDKSMYDDHPSPDYQITYENGGSLYTSHGTVTQTQAVGWINPVEQYVFKSVGDLSNAPLALSFVFYKDRAFCNATYNSRWLSEGFVKNFAIEHTQLLTKVVSPCAGNYGRSYHFI